jgi:hypothetical protein
VGTVDPYGYYHIYGTDWQERVGLLPTGLCDPDLFAKHAHARRNHEPRDILHSSCLCVSVGQLYRWSIQLQGYDYTVAYREGTANVYTDVLSRTPWNPPEEDTGLLMAISDAVSANPDNVHNQNPDQYAPDWNWTLDLFAEQRQDSQLGELIEYLENKTVPPRLSDDPKSLARFDAESEQYSLRDVDGVLMYLGGSHKGRGNDMLALIVVPQSLKDLILKSYHTSSLAGHFGNAKTYRRIRSKYFWKVLSRDAQDFCAACTTCHSRENPKRQKRHE